MVDVNTQNKTISVNVSSSGVSSNVNASGDTTHYYSEKAREWAISNRIVDGVDYSSKYYAGRANQSALNAQSFAQSAQNSYNNFQDSVDDALSDIDTKSNEAIETINTSVEGAIVDINKEVEDSKEEIKEAVEDIKVLTTLEIGDIGIAGLLIDETKGKRRYLNGSILSINNNTQAFVNKLKSTIVLYPSLACTEQEWQTISTSSAFGQCGKFVVDDEAGTIRLPKITGFIQGLTDLASLGDLVEAGLPNITGDFYTGAYSIGAGGAFVRTAGGDRPNGNNGTASHILFDASLSNPIYGNSDTVQPESIQYPYFIQVATGVEEEVNITNTFETNIPYTLLDSVYSEYPKYNASMLLSAGQENPKGSYPDVYDALLIEQNSDIATGTTVTLTSGTSYTKRGLSVKNSTDADITDFDFVVNTANESFVLATKNGSENLPSDNYDSLTLNGSGSTYIAPANGWYTFQGRMSTASGSFAFINTSCGNIATNSRVSGSAQSTFAEMFCKKGDIIQISHDSIQSTTHFRFVYAQGNGPLYFYVGTTTQNDNIVNLGRVEEQIANINALPHIVETYKSGTSWYRVYSDGWCEQGGIWTGNININVGYAAGFNITFLKTFKNTEYNVNYTNIGIDGTNSYCMPLRVLYQTANSCQLEFGQYGPEARVLNKVSWEAKGYIA